MPNKIYVFQLLNPTDGTRTEPTAVTRQKFMETLNTIISKLEEKEAIEILESYVLIIGERADDGKINFSTAPVFLVSSFIELIEKQKEQ